MMWHGDDDDDFEDASGGGGVLLGSVTVLTGVPKTRPKRSHPLGFQPPSARVSTPPIKSKSVRRVAARKGTKR